MNRVKNYKYYLFLKGFYQIAILIKEWVSVISEYQINQYEFRNFWQILSGHYNKYDKQEELSYYSKIKNNPEKPDKNYSIKSVLYNYDRW